MRRKNMMELNDETLRPTHHETLTSQSKAIEVEPTSVSLLATQYQGLDWVFFYRQRPSQNLKLTCICMHEE